MTTADRIHQLRVDLWNLSYNQWKTQTLFSIKWWSLIAVVVIFYVIWWVIVEKRRLSQILLFGSLIAVGRIVMDIAGTDATLWSYNIRETPLFPSPFLHDFTLTPLTLMVVYQHCHSWKKFLVWTVVTTGIISFVFFPILITLGFLKFYNWHYSYSFALMIGLASLARWVVIAVLKIEQSNK